MARASSGRRSVEDVLREIEKSERAAGLLGIKKQGMGLLSGAIATGTVAPGPSSVEQALQAVQSRPNIGNGASALPISHAPDGLLPKPAGGGLLATGMKPQAARGGLLAPAPSASPAESLAQPRSRVAQAGNFLDDFLFGGAAGERSEERRQRGEARSAADAHREAFAYASGPQGFDPSRYQQRVAALGQAPDMAGLVNLEGINDGRDVRGLRQRQEERGVTAGALAPTMGLPEDQRAPALGSVAQYLQGQGYNFDPNTSPAGVNAAVGAGMGADSWMDNARGDRSQYEQERAARAAEDYRKTDLGFRQGESEWERQYREGRATAQDDQFNRDLEYRRDALTVPNSTGDVLAPILSKVSTMGVEALNDGERLIWERYQQSGQNPFAALMGGQPGGAPPAPAPQAAPPQAAGDPFPGIAEGQVVVQDGVRYRRQGNQMQPVG